MDSPVYDFVLGSRYVPLGVVDKPYFSLPIGRMTKQKRGSNQPVGSPGRHSNKLHTGSSAKLKPLHPGTGTARKSRDYKAFLPTLTVSGKLQVSQFIALWKKRLTMALEIRPSRHTRIGHSAITLIPLNGLPQEGDVPSPITRPISPSLQNCPSHVTIHLRTELRRQRTLLWTMATS
ncbi:hypothetical protein Bpfe_020457 [Biomphalaria pfeifferi]|uniref:Uncharacterized protein n=1 Tax=Biomphalaria pfeifferi TaxID=112525 RepID=A0AAD8F4J4_BIOPF|nr:hypothetical protein Bpfe_020457 [Biomphalaria pfeifferi]